MDDIRRNLRVCDSSFVTTTTVRKTSVPVIVTSERNDDTFESHISDLAACTTARALHAA